MYSRAYLTTITSHSKDLYDLGARRIAVFSAPPIGCLPSQRTLAGGLNRICVESYNQAAQLYNSKLSSMLDTFANTPQSRIVYIDIYSPLLDLIQNPRNYGNLLSSLFSLHFLIPWLQSRYNSVEYHWVCWAFNSATSTMSKYQKCMSHKWVNHLTLFCKISRVKKCCDLSTNYKS